MYKINIYRVFALVCLLWVAGCGGRRLQVKANGSGTGGGDFLGGGLTGNGTPTLGTEDEGEGDDEDLLDEDEAADALEGLLNSGGTGQQPGQGTYTANLACYDVNVATGSNGYLACGSATCTRVIRTDGNMSLYCWADPIGRGDFRARCCQQRVNGGTYRPMGLESRIPTGSNGNAICATTGMVCTSVVRDDGFQSVSCGLTVPASSTNYWSARCMQQMVRIQCQEIPLPYGASGDEVCGNYQSACISGGDTSGQLSYYCSTKNSGPAGYARCCRN